MRHLIKGLIAAVAVMAAAPAMACGYSPCAAPVYAAPVAVSTGCNPCGGWVHERLPDPEQQYYYVNQGPTYTGPGNWAPRRVYREGYVSGSYGYGSRSYYGYDGGYRARPYVRPWRSYGGYRYSVRPGVRYGYAPRAYGGHYGMRDGARYVR